MYKRDAGLCAIKRDASPAKTLLQKNEDPIDGRWRRIEGFTPGRWLIEHIPLHTIRGP
jgi:hypothetical protein